MNNWFERYNTVYMNEADGDGGDLGGAAPAGDTPPGDGGDGDHPSQFDFVLDKYRADGRSEQEALELQAKSYVDLNSKFGSFTGAPEAYQAVLRDELTEAGVMLTEGDPMLTGAMDLAKELNMSQDGFNRLVNLYGEMQLAEHKAMEDVRAEEMKALGSNANQRIEGINKWIAANVDAETAEGLRGIIQSAAGVKALEQVIQKTRSAPVDPGVNTPAPTVTAQEVQEMQFAKDEFGGRRINTDPAFKAEYERKRDQLYGTGEHRKVVG